MCVSMFLHKCACTHAYTLPPRGEQSALVLATSEGHCLQPPWKLSSRSRLLVDKFDFLRETIAFIYTQLEKEGRKYSNESFLRRFLGISPKCMMHLVCYIYTSDWTNSIIRASYAVVISLPCCLVSGAFVTEMTMIA